jgi:hypothetical protein
MPLSLHDWKLQHAWMLRVVQQLDVRGLCVLARFFGHDSAAIVVLLCAGRIQAGDNQAQSAALGNLP